MSNPPDDDTPQLPPLPSMPPLLNRERMAAMLREARNGIANGHLEWTMEGLAWLAAEIEVDAAAVEYHQLQLKHHFEGTTYVPH